MKKILMVGAGQEQIIAIKQAKELGFFVVACDQNPTAIGFQAADIGAVVDIKNVSDLIKLAREYEVDGIFSHAVEIPHITSEVAQILNLPSISPEVAIRATNKLERIIRFKEYGIPCANFEFASSIDELRLRAKKIGYPLIMKPIDSAGSRGVQIVESDDQLANCYNDSISFSSTTTVLIEEKLSGPEVSTESLVYKDEVYTFAFADRNYARKEHFHPYFIEDGINYPTILNEEIQREVYDLVNKTIKALGIDFGPAKGDIIIDKGVPKVIEMAARTSGGWFSAGSIPIATGSNVLKPLLQMAVGDEPDLSSIAPKYDRGCSQRYIIPLEEGIVSEITGLEEAIKMPGVEMYTFFMPEIGKKIRKATNHAERFGQIICAGSSREDAMLKCEAAIAKIKIKIEQPDR